MMERMRVTSLIGGTERVEGEAVRPVPACRSGRESRSCKRPPCRVNRARPALGTAEEYIICLASSLDNFGRLPGHGPAGDPGAPRLLPAQLLRGQPIDARN